MGDMIEYKAKTTPVMASIIRQIAYDNAPITMQDFVSVLEKKGVYYTKANTIMALVIKKSPVALVPDGNELWIYRCEDLKVNRVDNNIWPGWGV